MKSADLILRLKRLAYSVTALCEELPPKKVSGIIEYQILKSAFSAASNYRAATKAISKPAFVSKLSIAFEEADETESWLEDIENLKLVSADRLSLLRKEALELSSILASARKTMQQKTDTLRAEKNLKS